MSQSSNGEAKWIAERTENHVLSSDEMRHSLGIHNKMHDDPSYVRSKHPETDEEIGRLGYQCGSHCGVVTVGHATEKIGHCPCSECHNGRSA